MRLKVGVPEGEARQVLAEALGVSQRFPADAMVALTTAEAALNAKDVKTAATWAGQAVKLAPRSTEALLLKGRAALATAAGGSAAAEIKTARASFIAANKIEPEHPEPLRLYYESFLIAGEQPTPSAIAGLHYASVLIPGDMNLRWLAAQQHLIDGQLADAKQALAPIAYDPHGGAQREQAIKVVRLIDSGDRDGAIKAFQS